MELHVDASFELGVFAVADFKVASIDLEMLGRALCGIPLEGAVDLVHFGEFTVFRCVELAGGGAVRCDKEDASLEGGFTHRPDVDGANSVRIDIEEAGIGAFVGGE